MDERRKHAYRQLLYWAMLDIRAVQWIGPRGWRVWSLPHWWRMIPRVRYAGAVADWLHNLAAYSVWDFQRFDEDRFWRDFEALRSRYPGFGWDHYWEEFERHVSPGPSGPGA